MMKLYKAKITDFTQADYTKMYSLLDCAIKEKVDKKQLIDDKKRSLAGYILLYRGAYEIYKKTELNITFNQNGKPLCDFCFFNISHSKDMVVCAFCNEPIGVDIQQIHDIKKREKYKYFTQKECDYVNQNDDNISHRYMEIFTKKEAALKMDGLSMVDSVKIDVFSDEFHFISEFFDDYMLTVCTKNVSIM